jgi:hypothetical protein
VKAIEMWLTADRIIHTVALPNPEEVLGPVAARCWAELIARTPAESLADRLESHEEEIYDLELSADSDSEFFEATPPVGVFDVEFTSLDELNDAIRAVETRWRIDVVAALTDLNDAREGEQS